MKFEIDELEQYYHIEEMRFSVSHAIDQSDVSRDKAYFIKEDEIDDLVIKTANGNASDDELLNCFTELCLWSQKHGYRTVHSEEILAEDANMKHNSIEAQLKLQDARYQEIIDNLKLTKSLKTYYVAKADVSYKDVKTLNSTIYCEDDEAIYQSDRAYLNDDLISEPHFNRIKLDDVIPESIIDEYHSDFILKYPKSHIVTVCKLLTLCLHPNLYEVAREQLVSIHEKLTAPTIITNTYTINHEDIS